MKPDGREFQVFVKPVGALCNLGCSYCYYLDKIKLNKNVGNPYMDEPTLEKYIVQHLEASTEPQVLFSWHGGEPTLAGINFYRNVVRLQKKHNPSGKTILNGIQTNGTLLDDDWCRFLADENFLAGISIDGTERLHNEFRKTKNGAGSFQEAIRGYRLLQQYRITTEILCVINECNAFYPLEIYDFFKSLGTPFISFLPLVEKRTDTPRGVSRDSVSAEAFGDFLITVFDEWQEKDIGRVKIQLFEEALRTAFDQEHTVCVFKPTCGGVPVLEHNGNLYSCDHFVDQKFLLGNIHEVTLATMLDSATQKRFGEAKANSLPDFCRNCVVLAMCNGECPKNRFVKTPSGEPGLNYLCAGYKKFFMHVRPFVEAVAEAWRGQE